MNWDARYSEPDFAYGTEPNGFIAAMAHLLPMGNVLSLAEGEGRNAVWLARRGYSVTAVDSSVIGLQKAGKLAAEQGVTILTLEADLGCFEIKPDSWDGIIACYCHLPPALRSRVHQSAVAGLKAGGVMLLEAFSKEQPAYGTGGPSSTDLLMSLTGVMEELSGLEFIHAEQVERDVREGRYHTGLASVIQIAGRKPPRDAD